MAINFGPFTTTLDAPGAVSLVVKAGPDPVVSCNAALFKPNTPATTPPTYTAVRNPFWPNPRTTSNVLPPIVDVFATSGTAVDTNHLVVMIAFAVLAPSTDPNFEYTALIQIMQNGQVKNQQKVALTNADLGKWHKYAFDLNV